MPYVTPANPRILGRLISDVYSLNEALSLTMSGRTALTLTGW